MLPPEGRETKSRGMKSYERHSAGRMFQSPFFEAASRVHPAIPFIFYTPIVLALLTWALWSGLTRPLWAVGAFASGYVIWQLMEYGLHRVLFHWEGNGPFTRRLHEIIHGYHHTYPDDGLRLVMPLGASIPLAVVIAGLLWILGVPAFSVPFFCGIVTGYMVYDFLHYSVHHHKPRTGWGKALRAHHMAHHFACPDQNFGISNRWLDRLFGTLRRRQTAEE